MTEKLNASTSPDKTEGYAFSFSPVRWHPYKPASKQFKAGIAGRWQMMTEYGGWENCPAPSAVYDEPLALAEAMSRISALEAELAKQPPRPTVSQAAQVLLEALQDPGSTPPTDTALWHAAYREMRSDHAENIAVGGQDDWPSVLLAAFSALAGESQPSG